MTGWLIFAGYTAMGLFMARALAARTYRYNRQRFPYTPSVWFEGDDLAMCILVGALWPLLAPMLWLMTSTRSGSDYGWWTRGWTRSQSRDQDLDD